MKISTKTTHFSTLLASLNFIRLLRVVITPLRGENDWKQSDEFQANYLPEMLRLIDPQTKFLPLQWKALPTKPWNCNGHKDSRFDFFANIFMTYIETTTLSKTVFRTTVWKCYMHDIFALWDMSKPDIEAFIEQTNLHHPTTEFTAETFDTEIAFLDTVVTKAQDSRKNLSLMQSHMFKKRKSSCTRFTSCHSPNVKKGFVREEALTILRNNLWGK